MMNLGRAKKKLRYFQTDECTPCQVKVKDIFTVRDLDNLFDDIDSSEPGTPLLSPLPKTSGIQKQQIESNLPKLLPSLSFDEEISPHKAPDCVGAEVDVQTDHLNNKESPLGELAPIKTSSPIELFAVNVATEDAERPETSPLLFGMDEEPVAQDLSKAPANPGTECSQEPSTGGSDLLVSPPSRLQFAKPTRQEDVPVKSTTPKKNPKATPAKSVHQIATQQEKLQHHRGDSPRISSKVIAQNYADTPPESQPDSQSPEAAEPEMKEHSFEKKILNALQFRINRKPQSEMTVRVPSPSLLDDQFMIIEDDAPLRFVIPKKAEVNLKGKPTPASSSTKLELTKASRSEMSPKHREEAEDHKNRPAVIKPKTKAKHGKTRNVNDAAQDAANEMTASIAQLNDKEQPLCVNSDTEQNDDSPGVRKTRRKNKVDRHVKEKLDGGAILPIIKPQKKKADKVTNNAINEKKEASLKVKKKNTKAKSSVKTDASAKESIGLRSENKQDKYRTMAKHEKKQQVEQWLVENHCRTKTPVKPTGSPETQSTCTDSAIQPLTKPHVLKKTPLEVKNVKKKEALKIKTLSIPLPEVTTEASNKRRRKPPGEWWLTQMEHDTPTQPEESLCLQAFQINQKSKKKTSPVLESGYEEIPKSLVENQNKIQNLSTVQKIKSGKKSRTEPSKSHVTRKRKNRRTTGDKRKLKSRVSNHRISTPRETSEEIEDSEPPHELSPVVCSPLRQDSVTPGDKRVFSKIYTRATLGGSAQKCVSNEETDLPRKRQRTSPKNFWEVPPSQQATNLSSPQDCSPLRSRLMMPPPDAQPAVDKVFSSHKTVGHLKKKGQANLINTPRSAKSSLAVFGAILASEKNMSFKVKQSEFSRKGRRNLLHSLEDQSQQSSETFQNSEQQSGTSHAAFEICTSGVTTESFAARKSSFQILRGSNQMADNLPVNDEAMPMLEVEHFDEDNEDLPLSKAGPQNWHKPRVLSDCHLCGPPLKPVVLEAEDWDNLYLWLTYMWPPNSKNCQVINPDDFHWYCHSGRAMGHMIDLQNSTFSSGKILLGSFMKKPAQVDVDTVTVFNVASSCVRVEINGVKHVHNSGRTFLIPSGQSYSIHNLCREPAVLWYHRMLQIQTQD